MDDNSEDLMMETERVADASKRPNADQDSSPRERKRSRRNNVIDSTTPKQSAARKSGRKGAKAVTPEPTTKENGATKEEDEDCLPMPPAANNSTTAEEAQPNKVKAARPTVTFAAAPTERSPNQHNARSRNNHNHLAQAGPSDEVLQTILNASSRPPQQHAQQQQHSRNCSALLRLLLFTAFGCAVATAFLPRTTSIRTFQHVIPPQHAMDAKALDRSVHLESFLTNRTLREFLTDSQGFHLAMAPSFFGFFGYFGLLAAWDEGLGGKVSFFDQTNTIIKSAAGASAGAMAAMLLAVGIPPQKAAEFCSTIDLPTFADPPGIGSVFKGDKFEQLMMDFMRSHLPHNHSLQMQDANIPVAVTGFDLQTMSTLVMTKGCAARSSRASATFPFLFQPVHWFESHHNDNEEEKTKDYVLIDGGVLDGDGLLGLSSIEPDQPNKRIVNVVIGNFGGIGTGVPPGPSDMPEGVSTSELLSISVRNLPGCGPWAMENGPRAVEAAKKAMMASLDLPLYRGKEDGHYELHIDASSFAPAAAV